MDKQSFDQTLRLQRSHLSDSCISHFNLAPLKVSHGKKQYLYDDRGNMLLDCINNVVQVGHCHPHVVGIAQYQMGKLSAASGFLNDNLATYSSRLTDTLPENLNYVFFLNSGSEANDLALQLAEAYTRHKDVITVENSYHGVMSSLIDISHLRFKKKYNGKKDHVHVVPSPDSYRGKYRESDPEMMMKYVEEVRKVVGKCISEGKKISAFLCEPLMSICGVIIPPPGYLQNVYRCIREVGGLCIADEIGVGLGRVGEHYWAFQAQDVIPDIVTCGKPMGNGYPIAMVATTREIADSLGEFSSAFGGNPVSCAVGIAVLDVISNEKLLSSAKCVGRVLVDGLKGIMGKHSLLGDVRGRGLVVGVDIVTDKESRKPNPKAAEKLIYKMKEQNVLVSLTGGYRNVVTFLPPLCFTCDNASQVVRELDQCLEKVENEASQPELPAGPLSMALGGAAVSLDVLYGMDNDPLAEDDMGLGDAKRARFEDMD